MTKCLIDKISGLYAGDKLTFRDKLASGIDNKSRMETLEVFGDRVAGDAQADPKHHGGPDRVLHHFPREHYGHYRRMGLITSGQDAPAMGENISSVGLTEEDIHIGDILSFGEVELQVTQPRSPCFKLNHQYGQRDFALAMQQTGMSGWFYRVLKPGIISCQDALILKQRRTDISVAEAMKLYFRPEFDAAAYDRLLSCEGLAASWVGSLQRRLERGSKEDWQMRLYGPDSLALN